jgi:hypothetical protein
MGVNMGRNAVDFIELAPLRGKAARLGARRFWPGDG